MQTFRDELTTFEHNGFALLPAVVSEHTLHNLINLIENSRRNINKCADAAGLRHLLLRCPEVQEFAKSPAMNQIAESVLGAGARPVKAILFDKTPDTNWYVTWHQDLTISVKEKIDTPGFGPWSIKDDVPHVQPPVSVLENILSLRIHIDDCSAENGAIKFIPGSHKVGILNPTEIPAWRTDKEIVCCTAERGDIIMMRPLILHSSSASIKPEHRRVLHIEYANIDLPNGLKWAEVNDAPEQRV